VLFCSISYGKSNDYNYNQYVKYKQKYFTAILQGDKKAEKQNLIELIKYGDKAKMKTKKFKTSLAELGGDKPVKVVQPKSKPQITKPPPTKPKETIKDIKVFKNSITISYVGQIPNNTVKTAMSKTGKYKVENYNIKGNLKDIDKLYLKIDKKYLDKIVVYSLDRNTIRISLRDKKHVSSTYKLYANKITITINQKEKEAVLKKRKIVMLDAGHGGDDSGAVGYRGIKEKNIVLKVTKKVTKILEDRGYKVYNTRTRDKFIQLKNRTKMANKMRADIFLSIHANSVNANKRSASGIEIYYLSPAKSARAKRVAALENKVDIRSMGKSSIDIFLMARNRAKINESNKLALDVQNNMLYLLKKRYKNIKDHGVRKGPFWILVGAQMPAILVELGFVSHPQESKRLTNTSYQNRLANGIANGIDAYFEKN